MNCDKIVTAHNQSDNTETVLLNLISGTGLNGIAGIPIVRNNIIRPLLSLSKKEIVDYLKNSKIPFRIDSSNLKSDYRRNFLRNEIIPQLKKNINPSIDQSVFRSAKILESTLPEIRKQIEKKSNRYFDYKNDRLTIDKKLFEDFEEGIAGDALIKAVRNNFSIDLGYNDYKKLYRLALQHKGKTVQLGAGLEAVKETGFILLKKETVQKRKSTVEFLPDFETELFGKTVGIEKCRRTDITINNKRDVEFVNADKLQGMFILRKWKNGDRFIPLGMNNFKKVSDFLTDSKVSSVDKKISLF
jgi:tRNA(Ile)-lysidine synthase